MNSLSRRKNWRGRKHRQLLAALAGKTNRVPASPRASDRKIWFEQCCQLHDSGQCSKDAAEPEGIAETPGKPFLVRGVPTKLRNFQWGRMTGR